MTQKRLAAILLFSVSIAAFAGCATQGTATDTGDEMAPKQQSEPLAANAPSRMPASESIAVNQVGLVKSRFAGLTGDPLPTSDQGVHVEKKVESLELRKLKDGESHYVSVVCDSHFTWTDGGKWKSTTNCAHKNKDQRTVLGYMDSDGDCTNTLFQCDGGHENFAYSPTGGWLLQGPCTSGFVLEKSGNCTEAGLPADESQCPPGFVYSRVRGCMPNYMFGRDK